MENLVGIVAKFRDAIWQRFRKQLERQLRVAPWVDPRRVLDRQMKDERESLTRCAQRWEFEGRDDIAEAAYAFVDCLPEIGQDLKRRLRLH